MANDLGVLILAAGKGTRMRSSLTKVLHPLAGIPLVAHGVYTAQQLEPERIILVVGHQAEQVQSSLEKEFGKDTLQFALQEKQLGTAHAVMSAKGNLVNAPSELFILAGDVPLLSAKTLEEMRELKHRQSAAVALLSFVVEETKGYGRILRSDGAVHAIREDRDCTEEQRNIKECNAAIYLVDTSFLLDSLDKIDDDNDQGEFYLTDIVELAVKEGRRAVGHIVDDHLEVSGINDCFQLSQLEDEWMRRKKQALMESGVTFQLPETTYLEYHVQIEKDAFIEPHCYFKGKTKIGTKCRIGTGTVLEAEEIKAETHIPSPNANR